RRSFHRRQVRRCQSASVMGSRRRETLPPASSLGPHELEKRFPFPFGPPNRSSGPKPFHIQSNGHGNPNIPSVTQNAISLPGHPIRSSGPKRFDMQVNGHVIPIIAYVTENDITLLGRPFTKRCSVRSDGKKVQEIVLHDENGPKTIYQTQRCKSPRTEHPINQ